MEQGESIFQNLYVFSETFSLKKIADNRLSFCPKVFANTTETLGVAVLKARGFLPEAKMYWIGVGALFGFTILFNICFTLALTYMNREYL